MCFGLTRNKLCEFAYEYAKACNVKYPNNWDAKEKASKDWYYGFMQRHAKLTLKNPEGMAIARQKGFNRVNVETFFNAYKEAIAKYNFTGDRIINLDESSINTVMKPCKVGLS